MNFVEFGRARRADFALAEGVAHLNHGGYGATPRIVLEAADGFRRQMEADPTAFFHDALPVLTRRAAERIAGFLGGRSQDWALVENATAGLNAVIASLALAADDEILCLSQVYGAVGNALRHHAERRGANLVSVPVTVPFTDPALLVEAVAAAIGPKTRLACFDHISSAGAVVLPVRELAKVCRERGVSVAIDGAHAPGQIALDVPSLGVDWYIGNLHKWAFAAKGAAVIWCAPARQPALHPIAISHHLGQGFTAEFDYSGTRDNSAWLAVPAALDYLEGLGPEAVRAHNDALAREAGELLRDAWNSESSATPQFSAAMSAVRLPGTRGSSRDVARRLARHLRDAHGITVGVMTLDYSLWIRVSAQIYNEIGDYRHLAAIGVRLAHEIAV